MSITKVLGMAAMGVVAAAAGGVGAADETAITIYSSAQPGAIPPELYRPIPGGGTPNGMAVPGYAMVRHDRPVPLEAGRSTCASPTWRASSIRPR
jgi:hypothetical protein